VRDTRVWTILNQPLFVAERTTQPRYLSVATRSLEIAMEYDRHRSMLYLANFVARIDGRADGSRSIELEIGRARNRVPARGIRAGEFYLLGGRQLPRAGSRRHLSDAPLAEKGKEL